MAELILRLPYSQVYFAGLKGKCAEVPYKQAFMSLRDAPELCTTCILGTSVFATGLEENKNVPFQKLVDEYVSPLPTFG